MDIFEILCDFAEKVGVIQSIFGAFSLYGIFTACRNIFLKNVKLSIGEFKIKRKYYDVQNITNIVSANFYGGGKVPDEIRQEIIMLTSPRVKQIQHNDKQ